MSSDCFVAGLCKMLRPVDRMMCWEIEGADRESCGRVSARDGLLGPKWFLIGVCIIHSGVSDRALMLCSIFAGAAKLVCIKSRRERTARGSWFAYGVPIRPSVRSPPGHLIPPKAAQPHQHEDVQDPSRKRCRFANTHLRDVMVGHIRGSTPPAPRSRRK